MKMNVNNLLKGFKISMANDSSAPAPASCKSQFFLSAIDLVVSDQ